MAGYDLFESPGNASLELPTTVAEGEAESSIAPFNFEGVINATFARACYNGMVAAAPDTVSYTQHQMRLLEAENTQAYDLIIEIGDGPEWHAPMNKAITFSKALAYKLKDVKVRPKRLKIVHHAILPWMMDAMVRHWLYGDYDFDVRGGGKGEVILSLREGSSQGPYVVDGLAMAHMQVYQGAKMLDDELLAQTALGKFMAVLSQVSNAMILIGLVQEAFSARFAKYDAEYAIRSLLVTHAYVWDREWMSSGYQDYITMRGAMPEFAQMLKEAYAGAKGTLQK